MLLSYLEGAEHIKNMNRKGSRILHRRTMPNRVYSQVKALKCFVKVESPLEEAAREASRGGVDNLKSYIVADAQAGMAQNPGGAWTREAAMRALTSNEEKLVRERAYLFWEREGRPDGRAREHWLRAVAEHTHAHPHDDDLTSDLERIVDGQPADYPAVLTKDVGGG